MKARCGTPDLTGKMSSLCFMRYLRLTIIAIFVCASGLAQTIEAAPSPISNKLELPTTPAGARGGAAHADSKAPRYQTGPVRGAGA
jgi:hypothetical protein